MQRYNNKIRNKKIKERIFCIFYLHTSEKSLTFALVIELERHIEILLLSNDCVIVPGLGGFMAHYIDARYDETDSTFLPPLRTLGFNPQLTMNDSLLVQSYIEAYDMSYPDALQRIEAEVVEVRQHLETRGEYEFNDIGVIRLNDEGNLEFTPCEAGILTPQLYGLSTFEMKPLVVNKAVVKSIKHVNEAKKSSETIIIKMSWLRNIAAVAAAVVAFLMISTPISNSDINTDIQQSAFIPIPQHRTEMQQQQDANTQVAESEEEVAVAEGDEAENQTVVEEEKLVTPSFCIVLASQVARRNAETFIEQLNKKNFKEARLLTGKMLRVVYGNYGSEAEAYNSLRSLRGQSKYFEKAWVMKVKSDE